MLLSSYFMPAWDLVIYLGILQSWLLIAYFQVTKNPGTTARSCLVVPIFAGFAVAIFWLTWGGYGIDAWRTLARFDSLPQVSYGEYLFWLSGHVLGWIIPDPWPLKILSAVAALILIVAYTLASRSRLIFTLIVMLAVPAFLLLYGNAVRQSVAGSLLILAGVLWVTDRKRYALIPVAAAVLCHTMSILPAFSLLAAIVLRRFAVPLFLLSYLVSPVARIVADSLGFDLDRVVRYSTYQEGDFHFTKVAVAAAMSIIAIVSLRRDRPAALCFREIYLFLVIASNCLLVYEVPFERLLLFADLALPLMLAEVVYQERLSKNIRHVTALAIASAGVLIWSSAAITRSLGYAVG